MIFDQMGQVLDLYFLHKYVSSKTSKKLSRLLKKKKLSQYSILLAQSILRTT